MPRLVKGPDGVVHSFPDDATDAEISSALESFSQPEGKSLSGFGENVLASGGKFLGDMVSGVGQALKLGGRLALAQADPREAKSLADDIVSLAKHSPDIAAQVVQSVKNRYGSVHNVEDTIYNDPVGVLGDIAAVAGAVESGGGSLAARLGVEEVPAVAKALKGAATVEKFTNPMNVVTNPVVAKGVEKAGDFAITHTVRPTSPVKRMAGQGTFARNQDIVQAIKTTGALTADGAERAIQRTQAQVDDLTNAKYKKATGNGAQRIRPSIVDTQDVARNVMINMIPEIGVRTNIGEEGAPLTQAVYDRAYRIQAPGVLGRPRKLTVAEALEAKRKAQALAYNRPRVSSVEGTFEQALDEAVAQAFKAAVEKKVPGIRDLHGLEQQQLIAKRALQTAEERPKGLHDILGLATGVGTAVTTGNPYALASALPVWLAGSPTAGVAAGIGADKAARLLRSTGMDRAALIAALEGRLQDQQDEDK